MKPLDRFIQKLRINKAKKYIPKNSRVLDIGCADGVLFRVLSGVVREGVGVDPGIESGFSEENFQIIKGMFPENVPQGPKFDAVTLLAVLEHIPMDEQRALAENIYKSLKPGGLLIISVPSPQVDYVLNVLLFLRLIDGMALHEHYGFDVRTVKDTFVGRGFEFVAHEKFQLGLNNLYVFRKP